ncbi:hypothetical protein LMH87_010261 [Akanthomyces muscarius]|uniref:Tat pathway signal sequence n=1 Tax=Akanthomyces muscarius TaxID=2231603 RepID=A0A9W8UKB6_AKAMU|nr:hypothetical protein LMH87_010261 [Akanthomyces muscarius]KAJ4153789.1 hypothetical protein LMH87_010261 [Akanthomyces muscarius]
MTIALYTWSIRLRAAHKCACETGMISSPAQKAVEYETLTITHNLDNSTSKYRGEPSPTIDAAWDELLQYNNIRVSSAELLVANLTSVALHDTPSGDSHLVTLDVYHTLHCVNRARKALYPAYYTSPNRPEVDRAHVEHCLDLLRQVLMCHGDVALHTYQWRDDVRVPWPTFATTHQCTRWDRIVDWSRGRSVESLEGSILQHPTLGVSYPVDEKRRAQGNEE